jgi:RNA polymerase sigma-70 factor (ECF subfamily)
MPWQPEKYRSILKLMARKLCLDRRLQRRFDSSDLVQQTLLKVHENIDQFRGQGEPQLLRWLQAILVNTARDQLRKERAAQRDPALEVSLNAAAADSSAWLERWIAAKQPSPEQEAQRRELLLAVAAAMEELPAEQREVVFRHYLMEEPPSVIAERLGRTTKAVAMLLYRGLKTLRARLQTEGHTDQ